MIACPECAAGLVLPSYVDGIVKCPECDMLFQYTKPVPSQPPTPTYDGIGRRVNRRMRQVDMDIACEKLYDKHVARLGYVPERMELYLLLKSMENAVRGRMIARMWDEELRRTFHEVLQ